MKTRITKKLFIFGLPLIVVATGFAAWAVIESNARLSFERDAVSRNTEAINDLTVDGITELDRFTISECNRYRVYTEQVCEEVETRVYSIDKSFQSAVTAKLEANGWSSDSKSQDSYFNTPTSTGDPQLVAQANTIRYANNDESGRSITQHLAVRVYKRVLVNDSGYFQDTRIPYSDTLATNLQNEINKGAEIAIITAYHQFKSWW